MRGSRLSMKTEGKPLQKNSTLGMVSTKGIVITTFLVAMEIKNDKIKTCFGNIK